MNHAHQQIRAAVVTMLTGLATTAARVYPNRLYAISDADLPAIRVFVDEESATAQSIHKPYIQERTLRLVVEGCAKANTALDVILDQISKEIEIALSADIVIGTVRIQALYTGSEFQDAISDKPVGVKRLFYDLVFYVQNNAPDVLL